METIESINLNKLRDEAYQNAVEHGWHDEDLSTEHFLCLVISELMEAVQAERKGKRSDVAKFNEWQGNNIPFSEETRVRRFQEDFEAYIIVWKTNFLMSASVCLTWQVCWELVS